MSQTSLSSPKSKLRPRTAAVSVVWATLNLIPVPVLGTDGWHFVRALLRARPGTHRDAGA